MNRIKEWLKQPYTLKEVKVAMFTMAVFFGFDLGSAIYEFSIHLNLIGWFDTVASLFCLAIFFVWLKKYSELKGGK